MGFFQVPGFLWLIFDGFPIFFPLTCFPACVEIVCFYLFQWKIHSDWGILVGNGIYIYICIYICIYYVYIYVYISILVSFFRFPFLAYQAEGLNQCR